MPPSENFQVRSDLRKSSVFHGFPCLCPPKKVSLSCTHNFDATDLPNSYIVWTVIPQTFQGGPKSWPGVIGLASSTLQSDRDHPKPYNQAAFGFIEAQFCNSVTHTRFTFDPKVQLLIHQPYVPIHNQGEDDFLVQGDNTIMRIDAAIRWFPISCSISSFICGGCEILFLQTGRVKQTSFWRSGCWRTGAH